MQQITSYSYGATIGGFQDYTIISAAKVADWCNKLREGILPAGFVCRHLDIYTLRSTYYEVIPAEPMPGTRIYIRNAYGTLDEIFTFLEGRWEIRGDGRSTMAPPITTEEISVIVGKPTYTAEYVFARRREIHGW